MFLDQLEHGSVVFIDANIFVYHFSKGSKFNPSCTDFLYRVEKGEIRGVTSVSVIQEACHRLMMIEASYFLQIEVKSLPKYLKVHPEIVKNLKSHLSVPADIVQLHVDVLPLDTKTVEKSQKIKELYGFLTNDALTIQFMKDHNFVHLASNDDDFTEWIG